MRQIRSQAAVLAALAVLASCSNDDSSNRTEPSPTGAGSTTSATPKPLDRPNDSISTLQPETAREMQDRVTSDNPKGVLDPGTYVVDVDGLRPRPVIELPEGFRFDTSPEMAHFEGRGKPDCTLSALACRWTRGEGRPGGRLKVGFWNGGQIKVHPELCGRFEDFRRPGPSVDDLAATLTGLPGFRATDPAPVSLGGYDGLYVELVTIAPMPGVLAHRQGHRPSRRFRPRAHRAALGPRSRRRTDRGRGLPRARCTDDQVAELTRIVESVTFEHTE